MIPTTTEPISIAVAAGAVRMPASEFAQSTPAQAVPADATLPIADIEVATQVRRCFDGIEELATSIREDGGLLQPLVVRLLDDGRYQLVAGERRLRAARVAGLDAVPVTIREGLTDLEARRIQIAENMQREDLTPFEEALGVAEDDDRFGREETRRIWKRGDAWVSKRVAAAKYRPVTLSILEDGLSGDFEILHSLNQLEQTSAEQVQAVRDRLEAGETIKRETVRAMAAHAKADSPSTGARRGRPAKIKLAVEPAAAPAGAPLSPTAHPVSTAWPFAAREAAAQSGAAVAHPVAHSPVSATFQPVSAEPARGVAALAAATDARGPAASSQGSHATGAATAGLAPRPLVAGAEPLEPERKRMFTAGMATGGRIGALVRALDAYGEQLPPEQHDWVLWSGLLDTVLPALTELGGERSALFMRRLVESLEQQSAEQLWRSLHPADKPAEEHDINTFRREVAAMPEGWNP